MSLHRFVACQRLVSASRNPKIVNRFRWQSSGPPPRRILTAKRLIIGLTITGGFGGGLLAYGNYNPVFKNQMNEIIPGFSAWVDKAADLWVDIIDYFNPKSPGSVNKSKSGNDNLVFEYNKAKARLEELKKSDTPKGASTSGKVESRKEQKIDSDRAEKENKKSSAVGKNKSGEVEEKKLGEAEKKKPSETGRESGETEKKKSSKVEKKTLSEAEKKTHEMEKKKTNQVAKKVEKSKDVRSNEVKEDTKTAKTDKTREIVDKARASSPAATGPTTVPPTKMETNLPPLPTIGDTSTLPASSEEQISKEAPAMESTTSESERVEPLSEMKKAAFDEIVLQGKTLENLRNKLEEEFNQKLNQALEVQKRDLEQRAAKKLEENETRNQKRLEEEVYELSVRFNAMLREQLRLENETHAQELEETLKEQAETLASQWERELDLKLAKQQSYYQVELNRAKAKLGGLENMVDTIAIAGEKTIHAQKLRTSCDALINTLEQLNLRYDVSDRYTISTEVEQLRRAARGDPFITIVLNSIPSQATGREGIQTEGSLKERFSKVKYICRKVALVPESGGGLGTYALSYIQSFLTITAWLGRVPEQDDADPTQLHTYDLLRRADTKLKRGDLEGAVHYMNYLQGEPRNVARDWLEDARLYLATRQAIQLLQAYVSAS